ncbi:MAG: DoxX family protein [Gemmataceae bacterium]|nr:DoxX family protein [Gemmataceae bacterium]
MKPQHKAMTWASWIITVWIVGSLCVSALLKLASTPDFTKHWIETLGYHERLTVAIGIVEIACAIIYAIPQSSILGAVLLTGYLGGAVATHVRVEDNFTGPVIGGVLVWLAVFLRDPRVRALLPICRSADSGLDTLAAKGKLTLK